MFTVKLPQQSTSTINLTCVCGSQLLTCQFSSSHLPSPLLSSPSGSYASSAELSRCSSQLSEEDYGGEYGERDPYDENDSYHSCHSSVSYSKGSPDWDPDETQGGYSDEADYSKDGGEEVALYEEEEAELYEGEEEGLYEDEEIMYDDEDLYNMDGTLSEDMEPPFTPTPTSTAPTALDVPASKPPLEKQPSLHQQQHPAQAANQPSLPPHTAATSAQPPAGQAKQPQTQPQAAPSATSFFSMAKPLTAAVTGLASTFLSSVPTAQPPQSNPPPPSASQLHQSPIASAVPPSHPATIANSISKSPSTTMGPSTQDPLAAGQPQAQANGLTAEESALEDQDQTLQLEDEPWPEEDVMLEDIRTLPVELEEKVPREETETEEHFEESTPAMPEEDKETLPER